MNEQLILALCGFLGVLFQSGLKYNTLSVKGKAANEPITFIEYLKEDFAAIVCSLASVGIWLLVFGEVAAKYTVLAAFTRCSFVAMGSFGSYILQLVLSKASKRITDIIDKKTNIADGIPNKNE